MGINALLLCLTDSKTLQKCPFKWVQSKILDSDIEHDFTDIKKQHLKRNEYYRF